jgi:hypothetical protein
LFATKNKRKKGDDKNKKMKEEDGVFFFSSRIKEKNHKEDKCKEGKELIFPFFLLHLG